MPAEQHQGQESELRESDAGVPDPSGGGVFDVFISYRIQPDEGVAVAFRDLLTRSIEPAPRVFVASAGGIRPSKDGFRPQIKRAAQSAKAFVAVITPVSKDREWLFFEAGAAWCRDQLYAPLLVGTSTEDLGPSIAENQASYAGRKEQVELLVRSLAESLGSALKPRFGIRYAAFEKRIRNYGKKPESGDNEDPPSTTKGDVLEDKLSEAADLWAAGKRAEANERYDAIEEQATDIDEKASVRITRILTQSKGRKDWHAAFLAAKDKYAGCPEYLYVLAISDTKKSARYQALEQCIQAAGDNPRYDMHKSRAMVGQCRAQLDMGQTASGLASLRRYARSTSPLLRELACQVLMEEDGSLTSWDRLILGSLIYHDDETSLDGLRMILDGANGLRKDGGQFLRLDSVALFAARAIDGIASSGSSKNALGIAYEAMGLDSLAYRAYAAAVEAGVTVGRVNMASIIAKGCPSAALEMLDGYSGSFDAIDPGYPYVKRAELERSVKEEETNADRSRALGRRIVGHIVRFADHWKQVSMQGGSGVFRRGAATVKVMPGGDWTATVLENKSILDKEMVERRPKESALGYRMIDVIAEDCFYLWCLIDSGALVWCRISGGSESDCWCEEVRPGEDDPAPAGAPGGRAADQ